MIDFIQLAQAGPVAILLVGIAGVIAAFAKGTFVPGWLYKEKLKQIERLEALVTVNTESLTALAKAASNGVNGQLIERMTALLTANNEALMKQIATLRGRQRA